MFPDIIEQMDVIKRGVVDLLPEDELVKKLERSLFIVKVGKRRFVGIVPKGV